MSDASSVGVWSCVRACVRNGRHPSLLCEEAVQMGDERAWMEGGLHVQDMRRHHQHPHSPGTLLSAHSSTRQHRCCCIVWSTKAPISPTGSFYSLAIVCACLTRPLMNAAVSRRSDARQREQRTTIYPSERRSSKDNAPLCPTCSNGRCRIHVQIH